jgi:hypothetical protein
VPALAIKGYESVSKQARIGAILAAIIVALGVAAYAIYSKMPKTYTIQGTITWLDPAQQRASLQFISPRKGEIRDRTMDVPPTCEILLHGKPAALGDLKVGDHVVAKVWWQKSTNETRLLRVEADRPAGSASSAPAPARAS